MWSYHNQKEEADMEFEKLVSPSLKDLFISHIEAMILSGELPVGQQLPPELHWPASVSFFCESTSF